MDKKLLYKWLHTRYFGLQVESPDDEAIRDYLHTANLSESGSQLLSELGSKLFPNVSTATELRHLCSWVDQIPIDDVGSDTFYISVPRSMQQSVVRFFAENTKPNSFHLLIKKDDRIQITCSNQCTDRKAAFGELLALYHAHLHCVIKNYCTLLQQIEKHGNGTALRTALDTAIDIYLSKKRQDRKARIDIAFPAIQDIGCLAKQMRECLFESRLTEHSGLWVMSPDLSWKLAQDFKAIGAVTVVRPPRLPETTDIPTQPKHQPQPEKVHPVPKVAPTPIEHREVQTEWSNYKLENAFQPFVPMKSLREEISYPSTAPMLPMGFSIPDCIAEIDSASGWLDKESARILKEHLHNATFYCDNYEESMELTWQLLTSIGATEQQLRLLRFYYDFALDVTIGWRNVASMLQPTFHYDSTLIEDAYDRIGEIIREIMEKRFGKEKVAEIMPQPTGDWKCKVLTDLCVSSYVNGLKRNITRHTVFAYMAEMEIYWRGKRKTDTAPPTFGAPITEEEVKQFMNEPQKPESNPLCYCHHITADSLLNNMNALVGGILDAKRRVNDITEEDYERSCDFWTSVTEEIMKSVPPSSTEINNMFVDAGSAKRKAAKQEPEEEYEPEASTLTPEERSRLQGWVNDGWRKIALTSVLVAVTSAILGMLAVWDPQLPMAAVSQFFVSQARSAADELKASRAFLQKELPTMAQQESVRRKTRSASTATEEQWEKYQFTPEMMDPSTGSINRHKIWEFLTRWVPAIRESADKANQDALNKLKLAADIARTLQKDAGSAKRSKDLLTGLSDGIDLLKGAVKGITSITPDAFREICKKNGISTEFVEKFIQDHRSADGIPTSALTAELTTVSSLITLELKQQRACETLWENYTAEHRIPVENLRDAGDFCKRAATELANDTYVLSDKANALFAEFSETMTEEGALASARTFQFMKDMREGEDISEETKKNLQRYGARAAEKEQFIAGQKSVKEPLSNFLENQGPLAREALTHFSTGELRSLRDNVTNLRNHLKAVRETIGQNYQLLREAAYAEDASNLVKCHLGVAAADAGRANPFTDKTERIIDEDWSKDTLLHHRLVMDTDRHMRPTVAGSFMKRIEVAIGTSLRTSIFGRILTSCGGEQLVKSYEDLTYYVAGGENSYSLYQQLTSFPLHRTMGTITTVLGLTMNFTMNLFSIWLATTTIDNLATTAELSMNYMRTRLQAFKAQFDRKFKLDNSAYEKLSCMDRLLHGVASTGYVRFVSNVFLVAEYTGAVVAKVARYSGYGIGFVMLAAASPAILSIAADVCRAAAVNFAEISVGVVKGLGVVGGLITGGYYLLYGLRWMALQKWTEEQQKHKESAISLITSDIDAVIAGLNPNKRTQRKQRKIFDPAEKFGQEARQAIIDNIVRDVDGDYEQIRTNDKLRRNWVEYFIAIQRGDTSVKREVFGGNLLMRYLPRGHSTAFRVLTAIGPFIYTATMWNQMNLAAGVWLGLILPAGLRVSVKLYSEIRGLSKHVINMFKNGVDRSTRSVEIPRAYAVRQALEALARTGDWGLAWARIRARDRISIELWNEKYMSVQEFMGKLEEAKVASYAPAIAGFYNIVNLRFLDHLFWYCLYGFAGKMALDVGFSLVAGNWKDSLDGLVAVNQQWAKTFQGRAIEDKLKGAENELSRFFMDLEDMRAKGEAFSVTQFMTQLTGTLQKGEKTLESSYNALYETYHNDWTLYRSENGQIVVPQQPEAYAAAVLKTAVSRAATDICKVARWDQAEGLVNRTAIMQPVDMCTTVGGYLSIYEALKEVGVVVTQSVGYQPPDAQELSEIGSISREAASHLVFIAKQFFTTVTLPNGRPVMHAEEFMRRAESNALDPTILPIMQAMYGALDCIPHKAGN